jgi:hypothetical protein
MHGVASLFSAVAALTDTRLAENPDRFGATVKECTRHFEAASGSLTEGLKLAVENVNFLRSHWNEEYDRRLREAGFRGSMFILQEWIFHLEGMKKLLDPILAGFKQTCQTGASKGWEGVWREAQQNDPVLGATTRPLCRACVNFAAFEEEVALTALVFNEYERTLPY